MLQIRPPPNESTIDRRVRPVARGLFCDRLEGVASDLEPSPEGIEMMVEGMDGGSPCRSGEAEAAGRAWPR